jgi:hypothetical protein
MNNPSSTTPTKRWVILLFVLAIAVAVVAVIFLQLKKRRKLLLELQELEEINTRLLQELQLHDTDAAQSRVDSQNVEQVNHPLPFYPIYPRNLVYAVQVEQCSEVAYGAYAHNKQGSTVSIDWDANVGWFTLRCFEQGQDDAVQSEVYVGTEEDGLHLVILKMLKYDGKGTTAA